MAKDKAPKANEANGDNATNTNTPAVQPTGATGIAKVKVEPDAVSILSAFRSGDMMGAFAAMALLPDENFVDLSAPYLKLEEDHVYDIGVTGFSKMANKFYVEGSTTHEPEITILEIVVPNDESGELDPYITAEAVAISSVQRYVKDGGRLPAPFRIKTQKREPTKNGIGSYLRMEVKALYPPQQQVQPAAPALTVVTPGEAQELQAEEVK